MPVLNVFLLYFTEEMKEDYDTMGPEATIQTTGNNGTGKDWHGVSITFLWDHIEIAVHGE